MIDKNGKIRLNNSHSLENLELGPSSRSQGKTRLNVTVLPKTSDWLKQCGNASKLIDELVAQASAGDHKPANHAAEKLEELTRENEELKAALSQLQTQIQEESEHQDYEVIRNKVLNSLKLGKQAPGYKSAVKALDVFIEQLR